MSSPENFLSIETELNEYRKHKRKGRIIFIGWFLILFFLIANILNPGLVENRGVYVYFGLWLIIGLIFSFFAKRFTFSMYLDRNIDIFDIPVYLSITGMFLIGTFGLIPYFDKQYLVKPLNISFDLPYGLFIIGIGYTCMWLGYILVFVVWRNRVISHPEHNQIPIIKLGEPIFIRTIIFYVILAIIRVILISMGGGERIGSGNLINLGVWNQWLTYFLNFRYLLLPIIIMECAKKHWPSMFMISAIVFELAIAFVSGWSSTLIKIIFIILGSIYYVKKSIPMRYLFVGFFIIMLLTPLTRFSRLSSMTTMSSVTSTLSKSVEQYWMTEQVGFTFNQTLLFARQSAIVQTPAIIAKLTPSIIPYRPTYELLVAPLTIIPRFIWPSKPEYSRIGGYVSIYYFGQPTGSQGSSAATLVGSAYMYGGWGVVILFMFFYGILFALLYLLIVVPAYKAGHTGLLSLFIGVVIYTFHIGEGSIVDIWQTIIQVTITFLILLLALSIRKL